MTVPTIKPKQLAATVTITFSMDADSQVFGYYDPKKMASELKEQLEGDELEEIISYHLANDTAVINVEVNVIDPNVEEVETGD